MRPSFPEPLTWVRSTEFSLAILRTAGVVRRSSGVVGVAGVGGASSLAVDDCASGK